MAERSPVCFEGLEEASLEEESYVNLRKTPIKEFRTYCARVEEVQVAYYEKW